LGTGCWSFGGGEYWGEQNQKDVDKVVHASVDFGINYFDTAEVYNDGRSEISLGLALKSLRRDKVIIGTKISPQNGYSAKVFESLESSLKRLNTDYVDIYMIHWPIHPHSIRHFSNDLKIIQNPPRIQETVESLKRLKENGKIRYIGVSNFNIGRIDELHQLDLDTIVNELPYNILSRAIENEILLYCAKKNIGVISYMTLLQGILADKYSSFDNVPLWRKRTRHFKSDGNIHCRHGGKGFEEQIKDTMENIRILAKEYDKSMSELAIQWAISNSMITCALIGARNLKQLESNVKAATSSISKEIGEKLNIASRPLMDKMGKSFDYYENEDNDRTL
jgi:aryl-alcohol dehydrogenase-like predicted oxidoreductase